MFILYSKILLKEGNIYIIYKNEILRSVQQIFLHDMSLNLKLVTVSSNLWVTKSKYVSLNLLKFTLTFIQYVTCHKIYICGTESEKQSLHLHLWQWIYKTATKSVKQSLYLHLWQWIYKTVTESVKQSLNLHL